jgi:hypothetical protein
MDKKDLLLDNNLSSCYVNRDNKMQVCHIQALGKNTTDFRSKGVTEQLLLS